MGIAMAIVGAGSLLGAYILARNLKPSLNILLKGGPISGALLTSQYKWWQPSLFNGV